MNRKLPLYECKILGTDETGIFAMSFVGVPANERNFVALKKNAPVKLHRNTHKQILTGAVLIPEQEIYRNDSGREYFIKFTAADIEKIAQKMMRTGVALQTTTHQHEKPLQGNYLVECWIVEDPKRDKSVALGLGEMPKGTLMASYKITSPSYWRNEVLAGKVRGFSIEGFFNFKDVKMSNKKPQAAKGAKPTAKKSNVLATMLHSMAAMLEGDTTAETEDLVNVAEVDETGSGTPALIFELSDGTEIHVDSDGNATIDGETAPAGVHALSDGNFIEIDEAGMLVVTTEEEEATEPTAAELAKANGVKFAKAYTSLKGGKTKPTPAVSKQIAALKAQIAKLEAQPSTAPAKAPAGEVKDPSKMTFTERVAMALADRRERSGK